MTLGEWVTLVQMVEERQREGSWAVIYGGVSDFSSSELAPGVPVGIFWIK